MTAAAGALKEDVSIKSVREVGSRRGGSARRAGTSATSLRLTYADVRCVCCRMLTDMPDVPVPQLPHSACGMLRMLTYADGYG